MNTEQLRDEVAANTRDPRQAAALIRAGARPTSLAVDCGLDPREVDGDVAAVVLDACRNRQVLAELAESEHHLAAPAAASPHCPLESVAAALDGRLARGAVAHASAHTAHILSLMENLQARDPRRLGRLLDSHGPAGVGWLARLRQQQVEWGSKQDAAAATGALAKVAGEMIGSVLGRLEQAREGEPRHDQARNDLAGLVAAVASQRVLCQVLADGHVHDMIAAKAAGSSCDPSLEAVVAAYTAGLIDDHHIRMSVSAGSPWSGGAEQVLAVLDEVAASRNPVLCDLVLWAATCVRSNVAVPIVDAGGQGRLLKVITRGDPRNGEHVLGDLVVALCTLGRLEEFLEEHHDTMAALVTQMGWRTALLRPRTWKHAGRRTGWLMDLLADGGTETVLAALSVGVVPDDAVRERLVAWLVARSQRDPQVVRGLAAHPALLQWEGMEALADEVVDVHHRQIMDVRGAHLVIGASLARLMDRHLPADAGEQVATVMALLAEGWEGTVTELCQAAHGMRGQ